MEQMPHPTDVNVTAPDGPSTPRRKGKHSKKSKTATWKPDQLSVLREYRDKGLTSWGTPALRQQLEEAAKRAQCTMKRVKMWIQQENRRCDKTRRRKTVGLKPRKSTQNGKRYRMFMSQFMQGKEQDTTMVKSNLFTSAAKAWRKAKKNKALVEQLDRDIEEAGGMEVDVSLLTGTQKLYRVTKIVNKIKAYCKQLEEELGYHSMFVASNSNVGQEFTGTDFGIRFLERDDYRLVREFNCANGASDMMTSEKEKLKKEKGEKAKMLKAKIRRMLNEKFYEATGIKQVAYKALERGDMNVKLVGWPDDVQFGQVSDIGTKKLQDVWKARDKIKFIDTETAALPEVTPSQGSSMSASSQASTSSGQGAGMGNQSGGLHVQAEMDGLEGLSDTESDDGYVLPAENIRELETLVGATANKKTRVSKPPKSKKSTYTDQKRKSLSKPPQKKKSKRVKQTEEEFIVEKIVAHKVDDNRLLFHVKWAEHQQKTWEPEEQLKSTVAYMNYMKSLYTKV